MIQLVFYLFQYIIFFWHALFKKLLCDQSLKVAEHFFLTIFKTRNLLFSIPILLCFLGAYKNWNHTDPNDPNYCPKIPFNWAFSTLIIYCVLVPCITLVMCLLAFCKKPESAVYHTIWFENNLVIHNELFSQYKIVPYCQVVHYLLN